MSRKEIEGQLDFLGLLTEYTDDQGARVRVSEPKPPKKKAKPQLIFEDLDQIELDLKPEPSLKEAGPEVPFKDCLECWCNSCRHNARLEGIPREMCGKSMPCPACSACLEEGCATICEINNAEEGCMTRAIEEGIVIKEEYFE